jgi:hypothetical protein
LPSIPRGGVQRRVAAMGFEGSIVLSSLERAAFGSIKIGAFYMGLDLALNP